MRVKLTDILPYLELRGTSSRVFIGLYMLAAGGARLVTGNTPTMVNVFSSRMYGGLLVVGALGLLLTVHPAWRCHWPGRLAALGCATLWLLIIAQAWATHAWVSISGACVFVLALGNEVRVHEC